MSPPSTRAGLALAALLRLGIGVVVLLALQLGAAGTWRYPEAYAYCAALVVPMMLVLLLLLVRNPELLERRMRTKEKMPEQARIVRAGLLFYLLTFAMPGFDRRFGWSDVPAAAVVAADACVVLAYVLFYRVLLENPHASRVVEVEPEQRVVTTGPYAVVRHPMYAATLLMMLPTPVALGSWWSLLAALPLVGVIVARIRSEERLLLRDLDGYAAYVARTRYRLLPGVW